MSRPTTPALPSGRLMPSGRQYRSTSQSPTRPRSTPDDLLSQLSPMSAVDAIRNPTGALKRCMEAATTTEQAFAIRTAVASEKIWLWLRELSDWSWPTDGSTGFDTPSAKRIGPRPGNAPGAEPGAGPSESPTAEASYMGSLPASEVARYDQRLEEIQRGMDDLDLEDIKRHVLHNHILPLSRPGTPVSEHRSVATSMSSYLRLGDFAAIITATIVQALPNLSRLTRLMDIWSVRLAVLRRVPVMLAALGDAEVAIQSGWDTVKLSTRRVAKGRSQSLDDVGAVSSLSRKDFDVIKEVLEKKVAKAGRELDCMLDLLEGRDDTLPDLWCDRMDALEREYAEWVALCERKIREADWAQFLQKVPSQAPSTETRADTAEAATSRATPVVINVHMAEQNGDRPVTGWDAPPEPVDIRTTTEATHERNDDSAPTQQPVIEDGSESPSPRPSLDAQQALPTVASAEEPASGHPESSTARLSGAPAPTCAEPATEESPESGDVSGLGLAVPSPNLFASVDRELPPPPFLAAGRPGSSASTSTIIHKTGGAEMSLADSPTFEEETPDRPRAHYISPAGSVGSSLSGSPPKPATKTVRPSVSFQEVPTVTKDPGGQSPPDTPLDSSFFDESDFLQEEESPSHISEASSADDQLQQQISEILESIPAKIRLSSQPNPINLNPPDLQLPYNRPRPVDRTPRSHSSLSSLSSRPGTPSFLLAPAYARHSRPRHQRGNSEIKLYHLSRSTGEPPIKLFIRCVGENGERVMVRVGGGWADLGEYLKDYASHHGRRSTGGGDGKIEVRDLPRVAPGKMGSSPASRPSSALDSPTTPLRVRKTRKSVGEESTGARLPKTPLATAALSSETPSSEASNRSRSSSRLSWTEEDSSLGLAGPRGKNVEMSEESKAWVESVKEKVRIASGERKPSSPKVEDKFGTMGKVGATKRLFRKGQNY